MVIKQTSVLGQPLQPCSISPITGFFRDGCCNTGHLDRGDHVVCVRITADFLMFSRAVGNDLATARPEYGFPGLQPGDRWCVCASRWKDALDAGVAPPVYLACTHQRILHYVTMEELLTYACDEDSLSD